MKKTKKKFRRRSTSLWVEITAEELEDISGGNARNIAIGGKGGSGRIRGEDGQSVVVNSRSRETKFYSGSNSKLNREKLENLLDSLLK